MRLHLNTPLGVVILGGLATLAACGSSRLHP
jgi:hypothetical protein